MVPFFQLGIIVATPAALLAMEQARVEARTLLARHAAQDWAELSQEDRDVNTHAVTNGFRILSAYTYPKSAKFWVITEADRSVTTILLPSDY